MFAPGDDSSRPGYSRLVEDQGFQPGISSNPTFKPIISKKVQEEGFEPLKPKGIVIENTTEIEQVTRKIENITRNLTTQHAWEGEGFAGLINTHILDGYNEFKSPPNVGIAEKHGVNHMY